MSAANLARGPLRRLALLSASALVLLLCAAASASAAVSWKLASISNSTVQAGEQLTYRIDLTNAGDTATDGSIPVELTISLPPGMTGVSAEIGGEWDPFSCPDVAGATTIVCSGTPPFSSRSEENFKNTFSLTVEVASDASGQLTAAFEVEGGGAPLGAHTLDPITVSAAPPAFGIEAFDFAATTAGAALKQAGGHPDAVVTSIDFNTRTHPDPSPGQAMPVEDARDVIVDLPAGLVGNPTGLAQCTLIELANGGLTPVPACPVTSQVGTSLTRVNQAAFELPLFNMVPPPGVPARFGFNVYGTMVVFDAAVRNGDDYGISVTAADISQALAIAGSTVTFWGVPFGAAHDDERACPGQQILGCEVDADPQAFFRTPTACTAAGQGLPVSARMDSWQHPGDFVGASVTTHEAPGYPLSPEPSTFPAAYSGPTEWGDPVGIEGCGAVPFEPTLETSLTTNRADSPTGLSVDIGLPRDCWDPKATEAQAEAELCHSDMREAAVTLPPGLSINPAAATGRASCSADQIGLTTPLGSSPIHFNEAPVSCPDAAKLGEVEITTPLLEEPLQGALYLAQQSRNPFNSLLATYLVAEGYGVVVKQAGEISLTDSGQLTTTFDQVPQTPFSKIHVELFGGPRAALRTPAACGTHTATATLTPWSGNGAVQRSSSFQITQGCGGGFDPKLSAGTQNPLAGSFSPFNLRLTREDASQELGALQIALPPGLIGAPKGIAYCPASVLAAFPANTILGTGASEIAAPKCPAASQLGTVTVGAGAGPTPFYTQAGKAYLAGPYKGAPLSLAVLAPAVAGPFDLGTVLVRNALRVDPESTQITALSDPLPSVVHGIPLDLRDVRVNLNRPDFTINPTSCEPMAITATLTSTQGASAQRSSHFQAAACDRLKFKPKLSLRLKGGVKRSQHPALTAILKARKGDANIGRVAVALPHSEFLAQDHIKTICTRVQFAAGGGGGEQCPKGSVYGKVSATSPLLGYPLAGKVYLRSSSHPLPDMVLALQGPASQPLQVEAVGRIDSVGGGIRTTFAAVPDAPLDKVVIKFPGGRKSLLENSTNLCRSENRARVAMSAHNGARYDFAPALRVKCGAKAKKHQRGGAGAR